MWTLEQVRAEYRRLDRLLGIDTSGIPVRFSKRMTRQYGVCTFCLLYTSPSSGYRPSMTSIQMP